MTELAQGPYRSAGELAKREALPAYLRAPRAPTRLVPLVWRPVYRVAPTAVLVLVALKASLLLGPVNFAAPFVTAAILAGMMGYLVTNPPWAKGSYRATREEVKEVFRAQGALHAKRIAEEKLRWIARRPWRWWPHERDRALVAYATICFAAGDLARVVALRDELSAERRRGLTFACAAVLLGDEELYRESLPAPHEQFRFQSEQWAVARSMGRLAGFASVTAFSEEPWHVWEKDLDEIHRKRLAYVATARENKRDRAHWPSRLDPWERFLLEEALRWLDRAGPCAGLDEVRVHLQAERARLDGGTGDR